MCAISGVLVMSLPIPIIAGNFEKFHKTQAKKNKLLKRRAALVAAKVDEEKVRFKLNCFWRSISMAFAGADYGHLWPELAALPPGQAQVPGGESPDHEDLGLQEELKELRHRSRRKSHSPPELISCLVILFPPQSHCTQIICILNLFIKFAQYNHFKSFGVDIIAFAHRQWQRSYSFCFVMRIFE